mgnify:CR=1 FL=1
MVIFLSGRINAVVFQRLDISDPVCIVADEVSVSIYDSVDGATEHGSRRNLVKILVYDGFVWHGDVGTSHLQSTKPFDGVFQIIGIYFKCQIYNIYA